MFNAQRILGALVSNGVDRPHGWQRRPMQQRGGLLGAIPGGTTGRVLVGAAGLAAAGGLAYMAYQHFKKPDEPQGGLVYGAPPPGGALPYGGAPQGTPQLPYGAPQMGPPGGGYGAPSYSDPSTWGGQLQQGPAPGYQPGMPMGGGPPGSGGPPPGYAPPGGPPPGTWGGAPAAQAAPAGPSSDAHADAMLLVRAMIAAAHVDGHIDPAERSHILERAQRSGLSPVDRDQLARELAQPQPPQALIGQIRTKELAEQFYVVSLLVGLVDAEAEIRYLRNLPSMLNLQRADIARLHNQLGIPMLS